MIKSTESLSMSEASEFIKKKKDSEVNVGDFMKKFIKIKPNKAKELRLALGSLDLIKLNDKYISKIIDLLPETKEELNKIFSDVNLDEEEVEKVLNEIKKFK